MRRCIAIGLSLFVGSLVYAQDAATIEQRPVPSTAELAQQFSNAYGGLEYLKMRVEVVHVAEFKAEGEDAKRSESSVTVQTAMAPGRMRTEVYKPDGTLETIITLRDGRVREYRPVFDFGENRSINNAVLEYDAPYDFGTKNIYLRTGEPCIYGAYLNTWLGASTYMVDTLSQKIAMSEDVELVEVDGRPAYSFTRVRAWKHPDTGFDESYVETLIVDRESMLALSLTGVQHQQFATITRTRTFTILASGALPEGACWDIQLPADGKLTLALAKKEGKEVPHEDVDAENE